MIRVPCREKYRMALVSRCGFARSSWMSVVARVLCLAQWIAITMAQSSTNIEIANANSLSSSVVASSEPTTVFTTLQTTAIGSVRPTTTQTSSTSLNEISQYTELLSSSLHYRSTKTQILNSSENIFYSSSTFSSQFQNSSDSIFTNSSKTVPISITSTPSTSYSYVTVFGNESKTYLSTTQTSSLSIMQTSNLTVSQKTSTASSMSSSIRFTKSFPVSDHSLVTTSIIPLPLLSSSSGTANQTINPNAATPIITPNATSQHQSTTYLQQPVGANTSTIPHAQQSTSAQVSIMSSAESPVSSATHATSKAAVQLSVGTLAIKPSQSSTPPSVSRSDIETSLKTSPITERSTLHQSKTTVLQHSTQLTSTASQNATSQVTSNITAPTSTQDLATETLKSLFPTEAASSSQELSYSPNTSAKLSQSFSPSQVVTSSQMQSNITSPSAQAPPSTTTQAAPTTSTKFTQPESSVVVSSLPKLISSPSEPIQRTISKTISINLSSFQSISSTSIQPESSSQSSVFSQTLSSAVSSNPTQTTSSRTIALSMSSIQSMSPSILQTLPSSHNFSSHLSTELPLSAPSQTASSTTTALSLSSTERMSTKEPEASLLPQSTAPTMEMLQSPTYVSSPRASSTIKTTSLSSAQRISSVIINGSSSSGVIVPFSQTSVSALLSVNTSSTLEYTAIPKEAQSTRVSRKTLLVSSSTVPTTSNTSLTYTSVKVMTSSQQSSLTEKIVSEIIASTVTPSVTNLYVSEMMKSTLTPSTSKTSSSAPVTPFNSPMLASTSISASGSHVPIETETRTSMLFSSEPSLRTRQTMSTLAQFSSILQSKGVQSDLSSTESTSLGMLTSKSTILDISKTFVTTHLQSTEQSQRREMSTLGVSSSTRILGQSTTVAPVSSKIATLREHIVYSSIYPCWVSFFIEKTIDASALYPNQTLITQTYEPTISRRSTVPFYTNANSVTSTSVPVKPSLSQHPSSSSLNASPSSVYSSSLAQARSQTSASAWPTAVTESLLSTPHESQTKGVSADSIPPSLTSSYDVIGYSTSSYAESQTQRASADSILLSPTLSYFTGSTTINNLAKKRRRRAVLVGSDGVTLTAPDSSLQTSPVGTHTTFLLQQTSPAASSTSSLSPSYSAILPSFATTDALFQNTSTTYSPVSAKRNESSTIPAEASSRVSSTITIDTVISPSVAGVSSMSSPSNATSNSSVPTRSTSATYFPEQLPSQSVIRTTEKSPQLSQEAQLSTSLHTFVSKTVSSRMTLMPSSYLSSHSSDAALRIQSLSVSSESLKSNASLFGLVPTSSIMSTLSSSSYQVAQPIATGSTTPLQAITVSETSNIGFVSAVSHIISSDSVFAPTLIPSNQIQTVTNIAASSTVVEARTNSSSASITVNNSSSKIATSVTDLSAASTYSHTSVQPGFASSIAASNTLLSATVSTSIPFNTINQTSKELPSTKSSVRLDTAVVKVQPSSLVTVVAISSLNTSAIISTELRSMTSEVQPSTAVNVTASAINSSSPILASNTADIKSSSPQSVMTTSPGASSVTTSAIMGIEASTLTNLFPTRSPLTTVSGIKTLTSFSQYTTNTSSPLASATPPMSGFSTMAIKNVTVSQVSSDTTSIIDLNTGQSEITSVSSASSQQHSSAALNTTVSISLPIYTVLPMPSSSIVTNTASIEPSFASSSVSSIDVSNGTASSYQRLYNTTKFQVSSYQKSMTASSAMAKSSEYNDAASSAMQTSLPLITPNPFSSTSLSTAYTSESSLHPSESQSTVAMSISSDFRSTDSTIGNLSSPSLSVKTSSIKLLSEKGVLTLTDAAFGTVTSFLSRLSTRLAASRGTSVISSSVQSAYQSSSVATLGDSSSTAHQSFTTRDPSVMSPSTQLASHSSSVATLQDSSSMVSSVLTVGQSSLIAASGDASVMSPSTQIESHSSSIATVPDSSSILGQSSSTVDQTLQPSPFATTSRDVVRILTSSLGQCIAYYTDRIDPKASSQQIETLATTSFQRTIAIESSVSSLVNIPQSTQSSPGLPMTSTSAYFDFSSSVQSMLSVQSSFGSEVSSQFKSAAISDSANRSTPAIIVPSIIKTASFASSIISASLPTDTTTLPSTASTASYPAASDISLASSQPQSSTYIPTSARLSVSSDSLVTASRSSLSTLSQSIESSLRSIGTSQLVKSSLITKLSMSLPSSFVSAISSFIQSSSSMSSSLFAASSVQTEAVTYSSVPASSIRPSSSAIHSSVATSIHSVISSRASITLSSLATPSSPITTTVSSFAHTFSSPVETAISSLLGTISTSQYPTQITSSAKLTKGVTSAIATSSSELSSIAPSLVATTAIQTSSYVPTTQPNRSTRPVSVGICGMLLIVPRSVNVDTPAYKTDLETNLLKIYVTLRFNRRRRAVTQGTTTLNVTSIVRQGSTQNVQTEFYVTENNVVVDAEKTSSTLNQLTTAALSTRLNQTVGSTVVVVGQTTRSPVTVTVKPPTDYQLLGMVLKDDASNSISAGNNKLTFETRMANYYKTGRSINDNVTFTVNYIKVEVKAVVYLEFYVTVGTTRQNSSTVASFYTQSNTQITPATLSALLNMTALTLPYSLSSVTASDTYQVVMTIRPVTANTNVTSAAFKADLAVRITAVYTEGKDTTARRKRRALGSISATIISIVPSTGNKAIVKFYILDQASVIIGAQAATIMNRVAINRMSNLLGVEVIVMPAALAVAPVAASKPLDLWIIGVVLGACVVMLLFFACLYWRWKAGGPKGKLDLEKIQMSEKGEAASKPYGGYREIASYAAQGRSDGAGAMKTTAFTEPPDTDEKPDLSRSMRRKLKSRDAQSQPISKGPPIGRQNVAYEESEEEYEDDEEEEEEEEDDDDYESDVPPPRKQEAPRPVSARRKVEIQPGPSRDLNKMAEKVQKSDAIAKKDIAKVARDEEDETESEDEIREQRELPAAAELPPLSKMKDVQEAPSYPPVRFRTNIEPEAPTTERLPPIFKNTSLIGRPLPDIDPDLRQKADLERSRNKQRQRLRASGRWHETKAAADPRTDRRAWKKAQNDIDALLDPMNANVKPSPRSNKRAKRRHRLRRSHKVDIAVDGAKNAVDENKNVKLNNYMKLDSPSHSSETERSQDTPLGEKNIEEARERIHTLLEDAFSLLEPYERSKKSPRQKVEESVVVENSEAALQQAPPESVTVQPRYAALPPPPHGRATAPLPGDRRRTFNYPQMQNHPGSLPPHDSQALTPVFTRDPMVVMDRSERNRYLSQRLGQSVYGRPVNQFGYPYEQFPAEQPVYITPVQQQADGLGGVIWSPYATEALRDDINNSTAPLFHSMGTPEPERYKMKMAQHALSTPKAFDSMQPRHTSIDMTNPIYDSLPYGTSPQPLIRAIKDELLRLSRNPKGKTQIQELRTSQDQGHPPVT